MDKKEGIKGETFITLIIVVSLVLYWSLINTPEINTYSPNISLPSTFMNGSMYICLNTTYGNNSNTCNIDDIREVS